MSWQSETCKTCRYLGESSRCRRFPPSIPAKLTVNADDYPQVATYSSMPDGGVQLIYSLACAEYAPAEGGKR